MQRKIVEAKEDKIVVNSAAGSGKTRCLTERVKYLLENGYDNKNIVVITFTNAAAEEMKKRLNNALENVFIGTIHSLANRYLLINGIDTSDIISNENFDGLFVLIKEKQINISNVDYLLLDEGQDSTLEQFEFLLDIIKPKRFMIFADYRQSIYSFNGAYPDYILKLIKQPEITVYNLKENYRCGRYILEYAKTFLTPLGHSFIDDSISSTEYYGQVKEIPFDIKKIISLILSKDNYKDWFILTRTNEQLNMIYEKLKEKNIPCDTFKKADLTNEELNKKLEQNTVKVLTIHTSKGLENQNVVVVGARYFNREEYRVCYVAATRAKKLLVWMNEPYKIKNNIKTKLISWS